METDSYESRSSSDEDYVPPAPLHSEVEAGAVVVAVVVVRVVQEAEVST